MPSSFELQDPDQRVLAALGDVRKDIAVQAQRLKSIEELLHSQGRRVEENEKDFRSYQLAMTEYGPAVSRIPTIEEKLQGIEENCIARKSYTKIVDDLVSQTKLLEETNTAKLAAEKRDDFWQEKLWPFLKSLIYIVLVLAAEHHTEVLKWAGVLKP